MAKTKQGGLLTDERNNKKSRGLLIGLLVIIGLYLIVTVVFAFIALPNTFVNGRDISYASKEEALKNQLKAFL